MHSDSLKSFVQLLEDNGGLQNTSHMTTIEQVCIFLFAISYAASNHDLQERFQHSGETISRHFRSVLDAIISLEQILIRPPVLGTPSEIIDNRRYHPYFKGVIGAIDGWRVKAYVSRREETRYRNWHLELTQNVMAVVNFDMLFTFVVAGYEGSASDMTVHRWSLERGLFYVPDGCRFLVDCGYANTDTFLTPFQRTAYHIPAWQERGGLAESYKELFDHKHAQLQGVVERAFGVWKKRFECLKMMREYPISIQCDIVHTTCIIYNFVHLYGIDQWFPIAQSIADETNDLDMGDEFPRASFNREDVARRGTVREAIALQMWNNYVIRRNRGSH